MMLAAPGQIDGGEICSGKRAARYGAEFIVAVRGEKREEKRIG